MTKKALFYLISPFILMIPAFYNGYPFVYSDTGTYIKSGLELSIPNDRPAIYGLLIRFSSIEFSLWPILYLQSLIIVYCLWTVFKISYSQITYKTFLIILFILSCFTGLGWYSSQIMPDIFTVSTIISAILLCLPQKTKLVDKILLSVILVLSINVHSSNFPITILVLISLFCFTKFNRHLKYKHVISTIVLAFILGASTNYIGKKTFKISLGGHVFLMGKMLDSGVLKSFLDDKCDSNNYIFCNNKDTLPENNRELLWSPNSPLITHGGWESTNEAYNKILFDIATSPKHLFLFAYNSFYSSISQLFQNDIGSGLVSTWYRSPNSPPYQQINKHFKFEFNQYNQSRQNGNLWNQELEITIINKIHKAILFLSFLFLIIFYSFNKSRKIISKENQLIILGLLIGVCSNAIVTSSLANVYDRLQARVSWLIIFCTILILFNSKSFFLNRIKQLLTNLKN